MDCYTEPKVRNHCCRHPNRRTPIYGRAMVQTGTTPWHHPGTRVLNLTKCRGGRTFGGLGGYGGGGGGSGGGFPVAVTPLMGLHLTSWRNCARHISYERGGFGTKEKEQKYKIKPPSFRTHSRLFVHQRAGPSSTCLRFKPDYEFCIGRAAVMSTSYWVCIRQHHLAYVSIIMHDCTAAASV